MISDGKSWQRPFTSCSILATLLFSSQAFSTPVLCASSDLAEITIIRQDLIGGLKSLSNYLKSNDNATGELLQQWFGSDDAATRTKVQDVFWRIQDWLSAVSFYCLYQNDGTLVEDIDTPNGVITIDNAGETYGYVDPADMSKIYLGLGFFSASPHGFNSKLGVIVHEMTHFWLVGNTDDIEYGQQQSLDLAKSDPESAIRNADNYEFFFEDWSSR